VNKIVATTAVVATVFYASLQPASAREVRLALNGSGLLSTTWIGIAASPNRKVFHVLDQANETEARDAAKFLCEQVTGRTCAAIAVPDWWDVAVISCARPGRSPLPIVAGSGRNAAFEVALSKAFNAKLSPNSCTVVYSD
jgi:hypothetical protein